MSGDPPPAQPPPAPGAHGRVRRPSLWRRHRNPLRRRTDRLRGWIALGLLLLVPPLALVAMFRAGDTAHGHYRASAEQQARTRDRAEAVLVQDSPDHPQPGSAEADGSRYPVTVRFTDPDGQTRTGRTGVPPGLPAGSSVRIWVGADGKLTEPPLTVDEIRSRAAGWALLAFLAVVLGGTAVYGVSARVLLRRDLAAWDTEWARTAPRWSTSA